MLYLHTMFFYFFVKAALGTLQLPCKMSTGVVYGYVYSDCPSCAACWNNVLIITVTLQAKIKSN